MFECRISPECTTWAHLHCPPLTYHSHSLESLCFANFLKACPNLAVSVQSRHPGFSHKVSFHCFSCDMMLLLDENNIITGELDSRWLEAMRLIIAAAVAAVDSIITVIATAITAAWELASLMIGISYQEASSLVQSIDCITMRDQPKPSPWPPLPSSLPHFPLPFALRSSAFSSDFLCFSWKSWSRLTPKIGKGCHQAPF